MTWGDEAAGRSDDFAVKALEPAKTLDAEHTGVLGLGATSPSVDPRGEASGAANVQASAGEGVWRRRVAPHHREAVKQFFSGPKHE
ncbi:MAG TPA: hypothetical protein VM509_10135 [Planctomycetota bacterium]|nr:hypothetical protein [Planctomycetota bacterium]